MAVRVTRQYAEALGPGDGKARVSRQYVEALGGTSDGTARVTRQYVEVLGPVPSGVALDVSAESTVSLSQDVVGGLPRSIDAAAASALAIGQTANGAPPKMRTASSPLVVSGSAVYVGPRPVIATSAILLTGSPYIGQPRTVAAASPLAMSQAIARSGTSRIPTSSSLSLASFADTRDITREVTTQVDLVQVAVADRTIRVSNELELMDLAQEGFILLTASSRIELTHMGRPNPMMVGPGQQIDLPATILSLSDKAASNIQMVSADSYFEVSDSLDDLRPYRTDATSALVETTQVYDEALVDFVEVLSGLSDAATVTFQQGKSLRQYLQTQDTAAAVCVKAGAVALSASDELGVGQDVRPSLAEAAADQLSLADVAAVHLVQHQLSSSLGLSQVAAAQVDRDLDPLSGLNVVQAITFVVENAANRYQYTPFVGEGNDSQAPTPPVPSFPGPMTGILAPFQLVYPAEGPVQASVTLRSPEFGNKERLSFNRINRETRGGTLIIYADPIWPKTQTLVMTFTALLRQQAQDLLSFLGDFLGQEVGLIDHEHRYWRGVITNPDEAVVQDGPNRFTANLEFEGELDPSWHPQVIPTRIYGTARASRDSRPTGPYPYVDEMVGDIESYTAEVDTSVQIGTPIYLTEVGHARPAQASGQPQTNVIGLAVSAAEPGFTCHYLTEGKVTRDDWSLVAGTSALLVGQTYFLAPSSPGRITITPPSQSGNYVVRVGRAVSPLSLDVEVELPIRL